jgi:hypothetical protein
VLVTRYAVVSHTTVSAALKDEPMTAYVDAVMVPSKPERKTLQKIAAGDLVVVGRSGRGMYQFRSR